jgi:hypothetical protein
LHTPCVSFCIIAPNFLTHFLGAFCTPLVCHFV